MSNSGSGDCFSCFPPRCPPQCFYLVPPPSFRLPPPTPLPPHPNHHLSVLTIVAIVISSSFLLLCFFRALSRSRRGTQTISAAARATPRANDGRDREARDGGLDQRAINSIVTFKYKKGDGLVQVTECTVCLNEFRDHETLRLLPNCTHAFHLDCIDEWLESHVNCPLCRAGIAEDEPPQSSSIVSSRGSAGRTQAENPERRAGVGENRRAEATNDRSSGRADSGVLDSGNGAVRAEGSREMRPPEASRGVPEQLDLGNNRRSGDCVITMMDYIPLRAGTPLSIQQSSSSAARNSTDNRLRRHSGGSSTGAPSRLNTGARKPEHHRPNQNRCRMMGNCSKGSTLHTRPVLMKRSFSTGRMVRSPRHGRRDNFLLVV
ncbi:hypothetical protein ACLOJK_013501 [Asimina triloba]